MGTTARVLVVTTPSARDDEHLLDWAQSRIEDLEDKWSSARPGSDLHRLNTANGRPVVVTPETSAVVGRAVDAWFLTAGRVDPTVGNHGCAEIRLAPSTDTATLPEDVELDLGSVGRAYAADLVAAELLDRGAEGALVDIGGDIRCVGRPPTASGWRVDVDDMQLALAHGAVATRRQSVVTTVVTGETWWAASLAQAACQAGRNDAIRLLTGHGVTGVVVHEDGRRDHSHAFHAGLSAHGLA